MPDIAELYRLLSNLVRVGTIIAVDLASRPARVRVATGSLQTNWLQWVEVRAGTTKTWNPPTNGEQVIILCPDGDTSAGIVFTGLNSEALAAPSQSPNEHVTEYPDGARIVYDHQASALTVTGVKTASVNVSEQVTVTCPLTVFDGKVVVKDLFTYQAGMSGTNSKGNKTAITGDLIHREGELSSNGVVLDTHTHSGVESGGSNTAGPN